MIKTKTPRNRREVFLLAAKLLAKEGELAARCGYSLSGCCFAIASAAGLYDGESRSKRLLTFRAKKFFKEHFRPDRIYGSYYWEPRFACDPSLKNLPHRLNALLLAAEMLR